jgi:peroxiredoxin family protein
MAEAIQAQPRSSAGAAMPPPELRPDLDLAARVSALEARLAALEPRVPKHKTTIVLFSGDMDKVMAAYVIATGSAAMGLETCVFHTFWGLMSLRRGRSLHGKKLLQQALQLMTPAGIGELSPSRLAFAGAGARIFRKLMRDEDVQSPEQLFALARELGVKITACEMSMDVMGVRQDELVDGVPVAGAAAYVADAAESRITLFI